jgi:hypothetical protein
MVPNVTARMLWVLGAIVVVAFGTLAARVVIKGSHPPAPASAPAPLASTAKRAPAGNTNGNTNGNTIAPSQPTGPSVVPKIEALSELAGLAGDMNAVFVFLPGNDGVFGDSPFKAINNAKQNLEKSFEIKIGVFALKPGSPDYKELAAQMSVPGVVAIVKTGVKARISGDLTEEKIVDGFLTAMASGGCCPLGEPSDSKSK